MLDLHFTKSWPARLTLNQPTHPAIYAWWLNISKDDKDLAPKDSESINLFVRKSDGHATSVGRSLRWRANARIVVIPSVSGVRKLPSQRGSVFHVLLLISPAVQSTKSRFHIFTNTKAGGPTTPKHVMTWSPARTGRGGMHVQ